MENKMTNSTSTSTSTVRREKGTTPDEKEQQRQDKKKKHASPLTMSNNPAGSKLSKSESKSSKSSIRAQKRARQEALEDDEEALLTAQLFGPISSSNSTNKKNSGGNKQNNYYSMNDFNMREENTEGDDDDDKDSSSDRECGFEIDRSGDDVEGEGENEFAKSYSKMLGKSLQNDNDEEEDHDDDRSDDDVEEAGGGVDAPAWDDPDDDVDGKRSKIRLIDANDRLKKLRKSRKEKMELTSQELEQRLRHRYEITAQSTARTDWASAPLLRTKKDDDDDDSDDDGGRGKGIGLFSTSESLFLDKGSLNGRRLPPNILDIVRCPDANHADPNKAVVQAVNFHPGSDPDQPLLLTAGLDKTLRFFQVGEEQSEKIHGIHFPKMPIYSANFLGDTGKVVVSGRRPFFYLYDAVSGNVDLVPRILGRDERSWERHSVSPDGQLIAFIGNDGYIVLVDAHSKHSVGTLKLNGSVRAIAFTPDGSNIIASGSDGDVYRWDIKSRRCIERFANEDGTITSCLAASSTRLAVGAESGVVNLYSEHQSQFQSTFYASSLNGMSSKTPLKSIMNLHTSNDALKFNGDGQILAFSSRREQHGLKLLHVPSQTVFSNWPTSKTPLRYVWSLDFSPQSKFLAIGNDKGKCLLYKLKHYDS